MIHSTYPSITQFQQLVELKDYRPPTKKEYVRCLRKLAEHYQGDPATLSQDQLRAYFLFLRQTKQVSSAALSIIKAALQLFFREQLRRADWTVFSELVIRRGQPLPLVLARPDVQRVLGALRAPRFRTCLRLIYHTGLRVGEAVRLKVTDLDGASLRLHVRHGKGDRDRCVPVSAAMLEELRGWWKMHRHPVWLFPAPGCAWRERGTPLHQRLGQAGGPMSVAAVQNAFRLARAESGIHPQATVHTLRHCYATHLLEEGVSLRLISQYLGHQSLDVTVLYTHLTATNEGPRKRLRLTRLVPARDALQNNTSTAFSETACRCRSSRIVPGPARLVHPNKLRNRSTATGGETTWQKPTLPDAVRFAGANSPNIRCKDPGRLPSAERKRRTCGFLVCNLLNQPREAKPFTRPVPYFLLTFTVPEGLRPVFQAAPKFGYDLLFAASAQALREVAVSKLGGAPAALGVLHTWSRQLVFHPHVHYIVPGGFLSENQRRWIRLKDPNFLLPERVLSRRGRNLFRQRLQAERPDLLTRVPASVWRTDWVVNTQPVGSGERALGYLAAYVQRTALSAQRIVKEEQGRTTFRYRQRDTGGWKLLTLDTPEFLRRFLQHVLPAGFHRVRYFGFWSPAAKKKWARVLALLDWKAPPPPPRPAWAMPCPGCGQPMRRIAALPRLPFKPP